MDCLIVVGVVVLIALFRGLSFRSGPHLHSYVLADSDYESISHRCKHCNHLVEMSRHPKTASGKLLIK